MRIIIMIIIVSGIDMLHIYNNILTKQLSFLRSADETTAFDVTSLCIVRLDDCDNVSPNEIDKINEMSAPTNNEKKTL